MRTRRKIYVQLEKALYGLPEAGRLWHEHLTSILRKIGYEQSEGSPCEWRKLDTRNREIIAESYVLIFVDDILHFYNGVGIEGKSIRDKLHEDLSKNGLPPLKSHELSAKNSITFLGLSVQQLPDGRIVSRPGYTQAIISGHQYRKKQRSPLPADFNSRKIPDEKSQLLDEIKRENQPTCSS